MRGDVIKMARAFFHFPAVAGADQHRFFRWLRVLSLWFAPTTVFPGNLRGHCTVPEEQPFCRKRSSLASGGVGRRLWGLRGSAMLS